MVVLSTANGNLPPADPGRVFSMGEKNGLVIAIGNGSGIDLAARERNVSTEWISPIPVGIPWPAGPSQGQHGMRLRATPGGPVAAGPLALLFWEFDDGAGPEVFSSILNSVSAVASLSGIFPLATPIVLGDPNPTTTRVGANLLGINGAGTWDPIRDQGDSADGNSPQTNGLLRAIAELEGFNGVNWDRIRALGWDTIGDGGGSQIALVAAALGVVRNDRTSLYDRLRQPDSFINQSAGPTSATSVTTTGIKQSLTLAQDGWLVGAFLVEDTQFTGGGILQLQLVRAATTYAIWVPPNAIITSAALAPINGLTEQGNNVAAATFANYQRLPLPPLALISGDTVQWNVTTAFTAGTADFHLDVKRQRAAF